MITDVKKYARARMVALNYVEHEDALNVENIPSQAFGRAFHVQVGEAQAVSQAQDNVEIDVPFTVRLFLKGQKNMKTSFDAATAALDAILAAFCAAASRLTYSGVQNVLFNAGGVDPVAGSNDNALIVRAEFTARVVMSTR